MDSFIKWLLIGIVLVSGIFTAGPCIEWLVTRTEAIGSPSDSLTKSELEDTRDGYTITYELDGGTIEKENKEVYGLFTSDFTLNNPSKDGYRFIGWTGSNGATPKITIKICKGSSGDLNFTANYEPVYKETSFYYNTATNNLVWTSDPHFTSFNLKVNGEIVKTLANVYELPITQLYNYFINGKNVITLDSVAEDVILGSAEVTYTYYSNDYSLNMEFNMTMDKTETCYILTTSNDTFVKYAFDGTFVDASNYSGSGGYDEDSFFRSLCKAEPTFYAKPRTATLFEVLMTFAEQANSANYTFDLTNDFYLLPKAITGDIGNLPNLQAIFNLTYSFTYEEIEVPDPEPEPEPEPEPSFEFDESSTSLALEDISSYNNIETVFNDNGGSLTLSLLTTEGHVLYIKYTTISGSSDTFKGWIYNPYTEATTEIDDIISYSQTLRFRIIDEFSYVITSDFWEGSSWHDYPTAMEYLFNQIYNLRTLEATRLGVDVLSNFEYSSSADCGMEGHLFYISGMNGNYGICCKFTSTAN